MTIHQIRDEIGVYNNILNFYIQTFDLKIFNLIYLYNFRVIELRDYTEVKQPLYDLLISQAPLIRAYSKDYYSWKTVIQIAEKIGLDEETILEYLNQNKSKLFLPSYINNAFVFETLRNFDGRSIDSKTQCKKISSYEVLKEIQLSRRFRQIEGESCKSSHS